MFTTLIPILIALFAVLLVVLLFFYFVPVGLWITAIFSGVRVGLGTLIGMRLRKVSPGDIVRPLISATKAGLELDVNQMEAHYLAGGNVGRVVTALISADRANIERLVGGAGEETIIARVGEGTVSSIGSAISHKSVLENPDAISKHVLERGLDAGTAYEILSIDIADVDIGRNIGAELQTDQAEADKKIAQAKAEERRAMAVANEQEMRARVVEAEAQVPLAIADAFRGGRLGVMDFYRMENVQADTKMRQSLSEVDANG
jgi:uncharacterized protein YqfA (UPF0365 family)